LKYLNCPIDRELDLTKNIRLSTLKFLPKTEPIFIEHFPDFSIYPGSMIINSVLATLKALIKYSGYEEPETEDISLNNIKFKNMCLPGDAMKTEVTFSENKGNCQEFKFIVSGYFSNKVLCIGKIRIKNLR
jgi:3-hydroxyacyl-[acyl-carrier-protein] dehydratase